MDKMLYISMNSAQQTMLSQVANSNNLANVNTTGFRQDFTQFRSMPVIGDGMPTRVYSMAERPATDYQLGAIHSTDRELDISIQGEGFIAVEGKFGGGEAYTRAGDLRLTPSGQLVTGTGLAVLGEGGPISIPPSEKIEIGADGTISIVPIGEPANALAIVDRIKLVKPELSDLYKDQSGLIRSKDGSAPLDASVTVISGSLEGSNVNAVGALVKMIELQRQYEMQVKMMKSADENSAASARMLQLGN
jgi:flagellar basal-body rod protein FlgF